MIAVVGPECVERIGSAIERAGMDSVVGKSTAVLGSEPELVVALGEATVIDAVRSGIDVPLLPVEAGIGARSMTVETAVESAERLVSGQFDTHRVPTVRVRRGDEFVGPALFDVTLVTAEPVRISEFGLTTVRIDDRVRADGVVITTPAGSHGYANAAGAPAIEGESDIVAVVPIGAFTMDPPEWVFDLENPIEVTVIDETGTALVLLDGSEAAEIADAIHVEPGTPLQMVDIERE